MDNGFMRRQRPVRAATIAVGTVALFGSGYALICDEHPFRALGFFLCYGAFLGWFVVGVFLAFDFRITRWWMASIALVFATLGLMSAQSPETLLASNWLIKVSLVILQSWLGTGCLLAVLGWWTYARRPRTVAEA